MDFKKYGSKPVFKSMQNQGRYLLDSKKLFNVHILLQLNEVETYDSYIHNLGSGMDSSFYHVSSVKTDWNIGQRYPNRVFQTVYWIDPQVLKHERHIDNIVNMLEQLGGFLEILMVTFALFLVPISEFSFTLSAIGKILLIRTGDKNLFSNN
jgi:hypothetical protein